MNDIDIQYPSSYQVIYRDRDLTQWTKVFTNPWNFEVFVHYFI